MSRLYHPRYSPEYDYVHWPDEQTLDDELINARNNKKKEEKTKANSLWQSGAKSFFTDKRTRRIGDIISVRVTISDNASLSNTTTTARDTTKNNASATNLYGYEQYLSDLIVPKGVTSFLNPANLINFNGTENTKGDASIVRNEVVNIYMAVMVAQILPNGNLVIHGNQQMRVNNEMRQVTLEGIIKPEDVDYEDTVSYEKIAEARVTYGGRGTLSDRQQPRIGVELVDILSPF
jgi:flagellar L-ring protein precursor FlgH